MREEEVSALDKSNLGYLQETLAALIEYRRSHFSRDEILKRMGCTESWLQSIETMSPTLTLGTIAFYATCMDVNLKSWVNN